MGGESEIERRRALVAAGQTDRARWSDPAQLESAWDGRARAAADFIPRGARVLDLGCGAMAVERFLPEHCDYIPCDLVARDERTVVCDFNAGEFPEGVPCDLVSVLGVVEYLTDPGAFLRRIRSLQKPLVLSYHVAGEGPADRAALGWISHLTRHDLGRVLEESGFGRGATRELGNGQVLLRLEPTALRAQAEKSVWVVSYANANNFGDRLGVHMLSQVLPAHAVVRHLGHKPLQRPEGAPDLLVVGLGNSLYNPLLTDDFLDLVEAAPKVVGIFGTQYRDVMPMKRLTRVLDRLETWFARYEEDALIYGRGRSNVVHLGDWLIDAFPMSRWSVDKTVNIRAEDVSSGPLDRLIWEIQQYRRVSSGKLHPLLCALTSAEAVSYQEQSELAGAGPSGKFRSMLLDIFRRDFPADQLWPVDRAAVVGYKQRVADNMLLLRSELARLLV